MKTMPFISVCMIILSVTSAGYLKANPTSQREICPDSLRLINAEINLYRCGDFYFGGQPPVEALEWLSSEGVTTVINLRSGQEMEQFASNGFNEDSLVQSLGMTYHSLPMPGQAAFNPETLESFTTILEESKGKVFIHCAGCYRVTYLMMAWLIRSRGYSIDEAVEFGRGMKYFSPLDGLLGEELSLVRK